MWRVEAPSSNAFEWRNKKNVKIYELLLHMFMRRQINVIHFIRLFRVHWVYWAWILMFCFHWIFFSFWSFFTTYLNFVRHKNKRTVRHLWNLYGKCARRLNAMHPLDFDSIKCSKQKKVDRLFDRSEFVSAVFLAIFWFNNCFDFQRFLWCFELNWDGGMVGFRQNNVQN